MKSFSWIIAGLVAGAVGAAVWAAVVYYSGWEIGWIAWGMGVLVGIAVAAGARGEVGASTGVGAGCIAAASVLGGKLVVTQLVVNDYMESADASEIEEMLAVTDERLVAVLANQLVDEREAAGELVSWPEYDEEDPDVPLAETYPAEIWADAQARWDNADESYRAQHRAYVEALTDQARDAVRGYIVERGFLESFTAWDLLWLGLAVLSAWRIGSGGGGE